MIWLQAILLLVSLILMARMSTKQPGQKPAGIEDFSFPSAAERPVQVVVGTAEIKAPNVLWYGDLTTRKITEKIKQLFSSKKVVVGHKYNLGIQLGLCYGPGVAIRKIKFGKEVAWEGDTRTLNPTVGFDTFADSITINKPSLFGGDKKGNGGVSGKISVYDGSSNGLNTYLKKLLGETVASPLKGLAYLVFENFYIGNSSRPEAISVVASRFPCPNLLVDYQTRMIGQDANPAFVIYEFLTNRQFGGSIIDRFIDIDSIRTAAQTLYDEGMGVSFVIDSGRSVGQVIDDILSVIQGSMITDPDTGKLKLRLIRNDFNPDDLLILSPKNISRVTDFSRGSLDTAVNELKLTYTSREKGYEERYVISQNLGLQRHKGDTESRTISMPMIHERQVAAQVVERELTGLSVPLATCKVECQRVAFDAEVGDVIKLTWPLLEIEEMIMRITAVDLGAPGSSMIKLTLAQDVFGVYRSIYTDGSEGFHEKITHDPEDISNYVITECPRILEVTDSTGSVLVAAEDPTGNSLGFILHTKNIDEEEYVSTDEQAFTPVFTTLANLDESWQLAGIEIDGEGDLPSYNAREVREGMGLVYIKSDAGQEWIAYHGYLEEQDENDETVKMITTIERGLFGTIPLAHPAGAQLFFISEGYASTAFTYDSYVMIKAQVRASGGIQTLDDTYTIGNAPFMRDAGRNLAPWPPGRLRATRAPIPDPVDQNDMRENIRVTWKTRDGLSPTVTFFEDNISHETETTYRVHLVCDGSVVENIGVNGEEVTIQKDLSIYSSAVVRVCGQKDGYDSSEWVEFELF